MIQGIGCVFVKVLAEHGFEHGAEMHAGLDFDGRGCLLLIIFKFDAAGR